MVPQTPLGRGARWTVIVAGCALAAVTSLGSSPAPAHAGAIQSAKAQAAAIESEITSLYVREDAAGEAYDKSLVQLHIVRGEIRRNTVALKRARVELGLNRRQLASMLVAAYKNPSGANVTAFLLTSSSLSDLVSRVDDTNRVQGAQQTAYDQVRTALHQVEEQQRLLQQRYRTQEHLVASARAHRNEIAAMVARQRSLLANAQANVRRLIAQRNLRLAQIARERAAAARRRAAEAKPPSTTTPTPPTTTGGGTPPTTTGGGDPGLPPPNELGVRAVQIAETQLGVRYTWGGASPATGFDCSGLVMWTYDQLGIHLEHYTGAQWTEGPHVPYDQLAPGDLVFFEPGIGHVGIYVGNGLYINAPHTGTVVQINSLSDPWAQAEYQGAVRVTG